MLFCSPPNQLSLRVIQLELYILQASLALARTAIQTTQPRPIKKRGVAHQVQSLLPRTSQTTVHRMTMRKTTISALAPTVDRPARSGAHSTIMPLIAGDLVVDNAKHVALALSFGMPKRDLSAGTLTLMGTPTRRRRISRATTSSSWRPAKMRCS
jgi:hypothetical protein